MRAGFITPQLKGQRFEDTAKIARLQVVPGSNMRVPDNSSNWRGTEFSVRRIKRIIPTCNEGKPKAVTLP